MTIFSFLTLVLAVLQLVQEAPAIAPQLATNDDNLRIKVDREKDISFERPRRDETTSVWEIKDRLDAIEKTVADSLETEILNSVDEKLAAFESRFSNLLKAEFNTATETALKAINTANTLTASSTKTRINSLEQELNGIGDISNLRKELSSSFTGLLSSSMASVKRDIANVKTEVEKVNAGSVALGTSVCTRGALNSGTRSSSNLFECKINKKRDDTVLRISLKMNARIVGNGQTATWYFTVDNARCRGPNSEENGDIRTRFHASNSVNLHRTLHLEGVCFRTTSASRIAKGTHTVRIGISSNGDCYSGWDSPVSLMIEEEEKPDYVKFS